MLKMILGSRLKSLREERNFSRKQVADALNVSATTVSYWERGNCNPSKEHIEKICEILNCSQNYFYNAREYFIKNDVELQLLNSFRTLPEALQKEYLQILQNLAKDINTYL